MSYVRKKVARRARLWPALVYGGNEWEVEDQPYLEYSFRRPGALHRKISKASRRLLDTQLNQLVEHGIVYKTRFDQKPLKVEYSLTPLGETLIPLIELTAKWGEDHRSVLEPLFTNEQYA